ncbi:VC0807 family protein [Streptomyces abikoensis]|uniref:VC0807 family protein n=1 Tax=Streptomyces abikoensis TaxID=97398 RepID=UPI00371CA8D7
MMGTEAAAQTGRETAPARTQAQKTAALRKLLVLQLVFELALPLGGYYGLRAAGVSQWAALTIGSLLALPWLVHGMVKRRRVEVMAVFTLTLMVVGALMSMVTGDPRTLLVRDSWIAALAGFWVLGTLLTRRPFMMTFAQAIVVAKIGEAGWREWEARWETEAPFRRAIRVLTAVWGTVLTLDAGVRVVLACTAPVDLVPTLSTAQWLVVLAGLLVFHNRYITRHGLKA